jgi:hypothetical protein
MTKTNSRLTIAPESTIIRSSVEKPIRHAMQQCLIFTNTTNATQKPNQTTH